MRAVAPMKKNVIQNGTQKLPFFKANKRKIIADRQNLCLANERTYFKVLNHVVLNKIS